MITGHQFTRRCRQPDYRPVSDGQEPPAFMVAPVTIARSAVRLFHADGQQAALAYLNASKVAEWSNSENPSMASGNQAVLDGFRWYMETSQRDGRAVRITEPFAVVDLGGVLLKTRVDVVLKAEDGLGARVVLWDAPRLTAVDSELMAVPFALAMTQLYPDQTVNSIEIWQARRRQHVRIPLAAAFAREQDGVDLATQLAEP